LVYNEFQYKKQAGESPAKGLVLYVNKSTKKGSKYSYCLYIMIMMFYSSSRNVGMWDI